MNENEIVKLIEPIFHFCVKRLSNRQDAEDLASEIMVHILSGIKKYQIESLEKWAWRIAYNRYARFIDMRNKKNKMPSEYNFTDMPDDYDFIDEVLIVDEYQQVFKYLHTLSSEYRNIMVDYYIGQLPIKQISKKYALPETTIKWRLNISREKIKTRIGENKMEKVYKRINWFTNTCNGNIDVNKYLHSQVARAICQSAYEKPLTVEEISIKTGLPTMYIEDELPRLIHGEAIMQEGNKYATNFIILRLCDKKVMMTKFAPIVDSVADYFTESFTSQKDDVTKMGFHGSDFGMHQLGYIALPAVIRVKTEKVMEGLGMAKTPFPPRLDGGYGWFLISERETESESDATAASGCNANGGADKGGFIYYYWIGKYFQYNIHSDTHWLANEGIVGKLDNGIIPSGALCDDDLARLIQSNLVIKSGDKHVLNFATFTPQLFCDFRELFTKDSGSLDKLLSELISSIHKSFKAFVPKRLNGQINQFVCIYIHHIIGYVAEELINRGVLEKPSEEKLLTGGVFSIKGKYVSV